MTGTSAPVRDLLWAVVGPVLWSIAFVVLYAAVSLGCRSPFAGAAVLGVDMLTLVLAVLLALHLAAFAWAITVARRIVRSAGPDSTRRFLARIRLIGAVAGAVATLCVGAPILFLDNCI